MKLRSIVTMTVALLVIVALVPRCVSSFAHDVTASNEYLIRVVDQHGAPAVGVPVWVFGGRYVDRPALAAAMGKPSFTTNGVLVPTDARGWARARYEGQYSMSIGVLPMHVPWPWIIPGRRANGDSAADFLGIRTDIEWEARIQAGERPPHPKVTKVQVCRGQEPPEPLWRSFLTVEVRDSTGGVFLPVPVLPFLISRVFPGQDGMMPEGALGEAGPEWRIYRRAQADAGMPWAHLVLRAGVALSATSGRPLVRHASGDYEASSWWVELAASAADLCPVDPVEVFPLIAPQEGYRQSLRWEVPARVDQVTSWVWLRYPGNPVRYGCWEVVLQRSDYNRSDSSDFFERMEARQPGIQNLEDNFPRVTVFPAKITARGNVYLNPHGSPRLERALANSQEVQFKAFMLDHVSGGIDKALSAVLYPAHPLDRRNADKLPPLTITVPEPPLPPPPIKELTRKEMAETEAMTNEEFARWMAARTASAAATR